MTNDEAEMMSEFTQVVNPVSVFIEDAQLHGDILRTDLYKRYKEWCEEMGHKISSQTKFMQTFRQTASQMGIVYEEKKFHGQRFLRFAEATPQ